MKGAAPVIFDERWYTVADIVEQLQVHEETVRKWIRDGDLLATSLSRKSGFRVQEQDLRAFLDRRAFAPKKLVA